MILTAKDKQTHQKSMAFFRDVLQARLKELEFTGELDLIGFGLHIDDKERYIYFDYPMSPLIDRLNEYLIDPDSSYFQLDNQIYNFLSRSTEDDVNYIAYQYERDADTGQCTLFDIKTNSKYITDGPERELLEKFFAVMYFSAHPEYLNDIRAFTEFNAKSENGAGPDEWFLFIRAKTDTNTETELTANFCLDHVTSKMLADPDKLGPAHELLATFADNYTSINKNILIKKVKERGDQLLTTNYLLFHWLKQVNMTFVTNPLTQFNKKRKLGELAEIIADARRIDTFYDRFVNLYKTYHFEQGLYKYEDLAILTAEWNRSNPEISFELEMEAGGSADHCFHCEKEYTDVMFRSIIENGVKALYDQEVPTKRMRLYWGGEKRYGRPYISITITSIGTFIDEKVLKNIGLEAQRSARGVNSGIGLYLVNRHLASLNAYQVEEKPLFFEKSTVNEQKEDGFTIKMLLPQHS